jgi:hypothetical protein
MTESGKTVIPGIDRYQTLVILMPVARVILVARAIVILDAGRRCGARLDAGTRLDAVGGARLDAVGGARLDAVGGARLDAGKRKEMRS